jgi:hypothetical protein
MEAADNVINMKSFIETRWKWAILKLYVRDTESNPRGENF